MNDSPENVILERCFLGEYEYAVDAQRRLALPKAWRCKDSTANSFVLLPGRGRSLQLVSAGTFQEMLRKFRNVPIGGSVTQAVGLATIGSMAQQVICDKQGRIPVAPKLMQHAGIASKAILVGAVTTIQIWEPAAWEAQKLDSEAALDVLQAIQERPDDFSEIVRKAVKD